MKDGDDIMAKTKAPKKKLTATEETSPKSTSSFYLIFIGEFVEIICSGPTTTTEIGVFPIVVNGYLLDLDENYLYLSDDAITVARAVKRKNVVTIEIVKHIGPLEQALMDTEVPDNRDEGN